ncbi:MAG: UPF0262 family protein [Pseudomonadota bacterium]
MSDTRDTDGGSEARPEDCIVKIELDERSMARASADIEHERKVAIYDLLEDNSFSPVGASGGPYALYLSIAENRLVFDIRLEDDAPLGKIMLSLTPFRKIIKDYFLLCESYYDAIRNAAPAQIETIDMARRGLHNEGSEILRERLDGKVVLDLNTARRLFTLICSLHMK